MRFFRFMLAFPFVRTHRVYENCIGTGASAVRVFGVVSFEMPLVRWPNCQCRINTSIFDGLSDVY
ncbi:MAG: hypothetical protein ACJA09_000900 [Alcanivorax sp.]|jgi:hypothetical protein